MTEAEQAKTPRAAGYVRVSIDRNLHDRYGIDAQITDVKRYVEYRGWQLLEIYREEGVSGHLPAFSLKSSENRNKGNRPELDRLLCDARTGKYDIVVFPSIDRAARSVWNMIEIDEAFNNMGIPVIFIREGIDTSDAMGQFFRNICASLAQFEGTLLHERLVKGMQVKAARGGYCGGFIPYGYRVEKGMLVIIEDEADVVRQIFKWRIEGHSFKWISDALTQMAVTSKRKLIWQPGTIHRIVNRPSYAGFIKYNGKLYPGTHKKIISIETFNLAQQVFHDAAGQKRYASKRIRLPQQGDMQQP